MTTKGTHTPGPWKIDTDGKGHYMVRGDAPGTNVCLSFDPWDARLIAAAPEILDLLNKWHSLLFTIAAAVPETTIKSFLSWEKTQSMSEITRALLARIEGKGRDRS